MAPPNTSWGRILQHGTAQLLLLSLSLFFAPVHSGLVNITVDDHFGDPTTGLIPQYSAGQDDAWNAGSPTENCPSCRLNPSSLDLSQIHSQTWHDNTYLHSETPVTITVQFTGSAVYVFNILPNTIPGDAITAADISFSIDGEEVGRFTRSPDSSTTILYNQLVYSNTALNDGHHTLVMTPGDNSLILFDYLIYTGQFDLATTSSTSSAPKDTHKPSTSSPSITPSTSTSASSSDVRSSQSSSSSPPGTSTSTSHSNSGQSSSTSVSTLLPTITPYGSSQSSSSSTSSSTNPRNDSPQSPSSNTNTPTSVRSPNDSPQPPPSRTPVGAIVGAALGGIVLLLGITLGVLLLCRRRSRPSVALATQTAQASAADGGYESGGHNSHYGDEASFIQSVASTTPMTSPLRFVDRAAPYHEDPPSLASDVPSPDSTTRPSLRVAIPAPPSMYDAGSAKHRAELALRLETLQRTRSVLSSPTVASQYEAHSGRGAETTIRALEAEIAELRAVLTSLNARLADEHRGDLLPAYAE